MLRLTQGDTEELPTGVLPPILKPRPVNESSSAS